MSEIRNLEPKAVWEIFQQLCDIPRPSKKEQKAVDFAKKFGEDLGLETIVDEIQNVIIKKPATPGMEDRKTVVLQGHLDMVPQKNSNIDHDFETDPIQAYVDGEWVTARDTTLGADNGMGVAAALAVLKATDLVHGPLEVLLTVDEETGMTGAENLKPGVLNADILINTDSEDEGELYIGCAGGIDTNAKFHYKEENVPEDSVAYRIDIKGLRGGHSGLDIALGRGNSNKLLNRILYVANKSLDIRLADIQSGSLRNAIPREGFAVVSVLVAQEGEFKSFAGELAAQIKSELSVTEPNLEIEYAVTEMPAKVIDEKTHNNLIKGIYGTPNGVIRMSDAMEGLIETSTNLAIVKKQDGFIELASLQRSSVESAKEDLANMIRSVLELAGAEVIHEGAYPGWNPNINSPILKVMQDAYNNKWGKVPEIKAIHAGLECGIIMENYPDLDTISFGPTIRFPHSPDEKVNIKTVGLFYEFLIETLKNIPKK
ncbi:MAG: aminoacyl-histidine dipeptidase [Bacteroidales bacterium]|jgi:dipeptidase D|nr:aminoacyl-histidine dipeptidase [Bacteroidales bacterium]